MLIASAAERNKGEILKVIKQYFDTTKPYKCLEIASGTGAHVAHFAKELPNIDFQPSEHNPRALHSIVAYVDKYRVIVFLTLDNEHRGVWIYLFNRYSFL
uniref:Methyltransferase-like 26 n=1 Tax=Panagrolaimus davidi TaxID=227884 RepID=A0A914P3X3_9BILA